MNNQSIHSYNNAFPLEKKNLSTLNLIDKFLLQTYGRYIKRALQQGLTKEDLILMRKDKKYFSPPTHRTSPLIKLKLKFKLLDLLAKGIGSSRFYKKNALRLLRSYERSPSQIWNPGLLAPKIFCNYPRPSNLKTSPKYEIYMHVIPSPYGFNWQTPKKLFFSLRNYLSLKYNHKIGHAFVELRENGEVTAATGMTGETNYQVIYDLISKKIGLDFLTQIFRGRLEAYDFVMKDINKHRKLKKIGSISFELTKEQFEDCKKHLETFCEQGYYKSYGLTLNPHSDMGASCTSFATSFLKVAGILSQEHEKKWKRKIRIPAYAFKSENKKIGLIKLIYLLMKTPNTKKNKQIEIEFWDPDLMYHWIQEQTTS